MNRLSSFLLFLLPLTATATGLEVLALDESTPQIVVPQAGDTYLMPRDTALTTGVLNSGVADGAAAVGFTLNTSNAMATAGSKIASFQNNGTEKAYIDKDGDAVFGPTTNYQVIADNGTLTARGIVSQQSAQLANLSTNNIATISGDFLELTGNENGGGDRAAMLRLYDIYSSTPGRVLLGYDADARGDVDVGSNPIEIYGMDANVSASTNLDGQGVEIIAGDGSSGSAGDADGGNVTLSGGQEYGTGSPGSVIIQTAAADPIGFFGATPVVQQAGTGETTGFTAGAGTGVNDDSTFTGNVGSTAYRISDVVKALKNLGLLAQ